MQDDNRIQTTHMFWLEYSTNDTGLIVTAIALTKGTREARSIMCNRHMQYISEASVSGFIRFQRHHRQHYHHHHRCWRQHPPLMSRVTNDVIHHPHILSQNDVIDGEALLTRALCVYLWWSPRCTLIHCAAKPSSYIFLLMTTTDFRFCHDRDDGENLVVMVV